MKYLAPTLVIFALLTSFAKAGLPGAVISATVTDPEGKDHHLWSNAAFDTLEECKEILDKPPQGLQVQLDRLRAAVEARGGKIVYACEVPTQGI